MNIVLSEATPQQANAGLLGSGFYLSPRSGSSSLATLGNRVSMTQSLTPVASRCVFPENGLYSASSPTITYRSSHVLLRAGNMLRFAWINQSYNGTAANAFTLTASVQIAATQGANLNAVTIYPLKFSGASSVSVQPGTMVVSDPIFIRFEAGYIAFARTCCASVAASNNWPLGLRVDRSNEGYATGDQTGAFTSFTNGGLAFTPSLITAPSTNLRSLFAAGDSILDGSNDMQNNMGWFDRWQLATNTPAVRAAVAGETLNDGAARLLLQRWMMAVPCSVALSEYGTNDINAGSSLATIQALLIAYWRDLSMLGLRVVQMTILPRGTSSNGWIDAAGQTPFAYESTRTALNDWLRAGAPVTASGVSYAAASIGSGIPCPYLSQVLDQCASVEVDSSNSLTLNGGRWLVGSVMRSGTATGGTTTSLTDSSASFQNLAQMGIGSLVKIISGTGAGNVNWVASTPSQTQINLLNSWTATDATSQYQIINTPTRDGTHPSPQMHASIASWFGTVFNL